jgi:hypothetical protein
VDFVVDLADGGDLLRLRISGLPRANAPQPELAERPGTSRPMLTLREGAKYRFEIDGTTGLVNLEPSELFDFDDNRRLSGRIEPGEAVGLVTVAATDSTGRIFQGRLDVRSQKFADEASFASMVSDLAQIAVEALHQGFAPSAGQFGRDPAAAPRLIYQQFAVLSALLQSEDLLWALGHVTSQPHRAWIVEEELRSPGRPIKGSSRLGSNLAKAGPRVPNRLGSPPSLPALVPVHRTEDTLDTTPNRYIRFVLERWRSIALDVGQSAETLGGAVRRRGVAASEAIVAQLDLLLAGTFLRSVGRLRTFPGDNPVLRRQEGYRQITAAAALVEGSLGLDLQMDDPLLISRRSVATLYEYWCFIKLADSLAHATGRRPQGTDYFRPLHSGMALVMRAGTSTRMEFETTVAGQLIKADLFFNNTFSGEASWTRPMRPDVSVLLRRPGGHEVWLHFDAKYKVDWERPFETGSPDEEEESERLGTSKRGDLLKMHAYRDAIRNSAGAYVLFPGTTPADFNLHRDELPGLGAFPLRPDHAAEDVHALEQFLRKALEHVASLGTRHHRAAFWNSVAYEGRGTTQPADPPAGIPLPPADTLVLCGYMRAEQRAWVQTNLYYNVRGDGRPGALTHGDAALDAPLLLLYGADGSPPLLFRRTSAWTSWTATTLRRTGYPHPRGESYLVAKIEPLDQPAWLTIVPIEALSPSGTRRRAPFALSWLDLILSTQQD